MELGDRIVYLEVVWVVQLSRLEAQIHGQYDTYLFPNAIVDLPSSVPSDIGLPLQAFGRRSAVFFLSYLQ